MLALGCSRSYRVLPGLNLKSLSRSRFVIITLQTDLSYRGVGSLQIAPIGSQESFRRSVVYGATKNLAQFGIDGIDISDSQLPLSSEMRRLLIFEAQLERRKILSEMELQGSFTRYAKYVSTAPLNSLTSKVLQDKADQLGVAGFVLITLKATKLTGFEYARELIRGALITVLTLFSNTTIAYRAYISGDIIVVDGRSGKALFFNSITDFSGSPGSDEDSFNLFRQLLSPLT